MPAIAPPDKDLGIVDCELAELDLDGTLPAVIVVVATTVSAEVLKLVALDEVESEVEVKVDEGPCESKSAFTIASTRNRDLNVPPATTRTATYQAVDSTLNYLYQSQRTNDSQSEQRSSPEPVSHPYHRYLVCAYSLATYSPI